LGWAQAQRHFPVYLGAVFGLLREPDSIVESAGLRQLIERNLPYARLEEAAIPVQVTATSLEGIGVLLSTGPAIESILATTAIPGIFLPVHLGGDVLMDGAIANNTPILTAAKLGASTGHRAANGKSPAPSKNRRKGQLPGPGTRSPC
jgi:NTE family protein